jgi:DNA-binding transcriptional regulator LsrR (DeoR family)
MTENQRLMIKIAKLYYEDGLTQHKIAERLRLSRPRVSRLLQEAIRQGIVKISIAQTRDSHADLEKLLEKRFNLLETIVVDIAEPMTPEVVSRNLGLVAAEYFNRIVFDGDVIGLTWGATLASMVENLQQEKKQNCLVIQLVGGLGDPETNTHAIDLVSRIAISLGARMSLMPAPGVVNSAESAALLCADRYIRQALELVKKTDVAFVGIGATERNSLLMRDEQIITWKEMDQLRAMGAVGDISLHFYDIHGAQIDTELNSRVIGISYQDLKNIQRVVGIAGGPEKFKAILGAIRGKLINTLVTDSATAQKLLDEVQ